METQSLAVMVAGELDHTVKNLKNGTKVTFIGQKEYGKLHNLKGNPLKRAHAKYRLEFGVQANVYVSNLIAGGQWVSQGVTKSVDKAGHGEMTIKLKSAAAFPVEKSVGECSVAELLAAVELAKKKEAAAAKSDAGAEGGAK